ELASREDGTISPIDLQILATAVRDLPGTMGFTAETLQSLSGLEGALESYLLAQLANAPAGRKVALEVLRVLSELDQGLSMGWLSAVAITKRLGREYGDAPASKTIEWLATFPLKILQTVAALQAKCAGLATVGVVGSRMRR